MTELVATGKISTLNFYARRIRRLLPALLVVMLASLPFAWIYMLPEQLADFSKSLVTSLLFSSNLYWFYSFQEYGADSALIKPFLHTWSLAIEEQYYIVFPLVLFAIFKFARRYMAAILLAMFVASLLLAQWLTARDLSMSFYMMPTRLWELLAGSMLALFILNRPLSTPGSRWQRWMPCLGVVLIIASLISVGYDSHHPGYVTLFPVLGTILIISFTRDEDWVIRTLSSPSMVYLGLLSYSLYLWHYPIFAFGRIANSEPSIAIKLLWIALAMLLSMLSYHFVERPYRSKRVSAKVLAFSLGFATALVISVSSYWILISRAPVEDNYLNRLLSSSRSAEVKQGDFNCSSGANLISFGMEDSCIFENYPGSPTLVLIGDSHAAAISGSVRAIAKENELNYAHVTQHGCPHLKVSDVTNDIHGCFSRAQSLGAFLQKLERPIIIYSVNLPLYLEDRHRETNLFTRVVQNTLKETHPDGTANAVVDTLSGWVGDGYDVVIVYPGPMHSFQTFKSLRRIRPSISNIDQLPMLFTDLDTYKSQVANSDKTLDRIKGPRVKRVYPGKIFCREDTRRCLASESDRLYFKDASHVGALGSDLIVRDIAAQLNLKVPRSFRE